MPVTGERYPVPGTNCLVLGGGGFIGTHLCRALAQNGANVRAFGRRLSYPEALKDIGWIQADFADRTALARAVDGVEIVFHLLGGSLPESSNRDPVADLLASTAASLHLLDACRVTGVRKIVFVSSGGTVYGIPAEIPIPETAPTDPISAYGISKLAVEKYLYLYRHLHGMDYTILRVSNPYGPLQSPDRRQGVIPALLHKAIIGQPVEIWGTGEVVRDFLHVADVVQALIAAASYSGEHRIFNVGSGIGRSIRQIIQDIPLVLGREQIDVLYKPSRPTDVPANVLDTTRIRDELHWSPRIGWMDGLRDTADWLRHLSASVESGRSP